MTCGPASARDVGNCDSQAIDFPVTPYSEHCRQHLMYVTVLLPSDIKRIKCASVSILNDL